MDQSESDLVKARKIVQGLRARRGSFVGSIGALDENVAKAVAEGIALGRKEGIALAIARLQATARTLGEPGPGPIPSPFSGRSLGALNLDVGFD